MLQISPERASVLFNIDVESRKLKTGFCLMLHV